MNFLHQNYHVFVWDFINIFYDVQASTDEKKCKYTIQQSINI